MSIFNVIVEWFKGLLFSHREVISNNNKERGIDVIIDTPINDVPTKSPKRYKLPKNPTIKDGMDLLNIVGRPPNTFSSEIPPDIKPLAKRYFKPTKPKSTKTKPKNPKKK